MPPKKNAPASGKLGGRRKKGPAGGRGTPDQGDTPTLPGLQPQMGGEMKPEQVTWLTPYALEWERRFGTKPNATIRIMARVLRPLDVQHGSPRVCAALRTYLMDVEAKYVSIQKFADTFAEWDQNGHAATALPEEKGLWRPTFRVAP